jgi:hypothetical protein
MTLRFPARSPSERGPRPIRRQLLLTAGLAVPSPAPAKTRGGSLGDSDPSTSYRQDKPGSDRAFRSVSTPRGEKDLHRGTAMHGLNPTIRQPQGLPSVVRGPSMEEIHPSMFVASCGSTACQEAIQ